MKNSMVEKKKKLTRALSLSVWRLNLDAGPGLISSNKAPEKRTIHGPPVVQEQPHLGDPSAVPVNSVLLYNLVYSGGYRRNE